MIWLYRLILFVAAPFILIRLWLRSRKNPDYGQRLLERTGRLPTTPKAGCIWVHAVSVGESVAATPLINALLKRYPKQDMVVTCTTPTGSKTIQKSFGQRVHHSYLPYDYGVFINRFLKQAQPQLLIIMETELWPNLLLRCQQQSVKTVIANLRLNDKSFLSYKRLRPLFRPILQKIDIFLAQTEIDAQRIITMGAESKSVSITGNLKYDNVDLSPEDNGLLASQLNATSRIVWCAGSTHQGEDEVILEVHHALSQQNHDALLVLAPRHPERFSEVTLLAEARFSTQRWSKLTEQEQCTFAEKTQVLILDTIGDLKQFISLSDFCFTGGSLVNVGGHNILEACSAGVPVLFGPYMQNFKQVAKQVVQQGAGFQVADKAELVSRVQSLAVDPAKRKTLAENGLSLVLQNKGALDKTLESIDLLNKEEW